MLCASKEDKEFSTGRRWLRKPKVYPRVVSPKEWNIVLRQICARLMKSREGEWKAWTMDIFAVDGRRVIAKGNQIEND